MREPSTSDQLLVQERSPFPVRLQHVGISKRVKKIVKRIGLRDTMIPGKKRYEVQLDHGFRKYFNTMLRRARVNFADKEDMMGHKTGLESSYDRYVEDFERFSEYQKTIPFLTISDAERNYYEIKKLKEEKSELEKKDSQHGRRSSPEAQRRPEKGWMVITIQYMMAISLQPYLAGYGH